MLIKEINKNFLLPIEFDSHKKEIFENLYEDLELLKQTNSKNIVLNFNNKEVANLPLSSLSTDVPIYNRKWKKHISTKKINSRIDFKSLKIFDALKKILMRISIFSELMRIMKTI